MINTKLKKKNYKHSWILNAFIYIYFFLKKKKKKYKKKKKKKKVKKY